MHHGGKLAGAKLTEQLMGVIDISSHCFLPTEFFYVGLTSSLRMLSETIARGQASSSHHRRRPRPRTAASCGHGDERSTLRPERVTFRPRLSRAWVKNEVRVGGRLPL